MDNSGGGSALVEWRRMQRQVVNPWRCQSVSDEESQPTRPLLGLRPLNLSRRNDVIPTDDALKPCPRDQWYVIKDPKQAYWRVLISNKRDGDRSKSIVGENGHLERANAWTHLIPAILFANWAVIRVWVIDQHSFAAQLSGASCVAISIMFTVSMVYHVYNSVPGLDSVARNIDIVAIYMSMAVGNMADVSMLTNDFADVPFHTFADPILAASALVFFFAVRRWFLPNEETRDFQFEESCSLGLFRYNHSDLEHAGLRVAGVVGLTLSWILSVSAAFNNTPDAVAAVWLAGVSFATLMLISGVVFDNMLLPDNAYAKHEHAWYKCTGCNSKRLGCAMTSHSWWHVISFVGVVVMTTAREYGVTRLNWTESS